MGEVIELTGIEEINSRLAKLKNRSKLMSGIGQRLKEDYRLGFSRSIAPDGSKWLPLKVRKGQPLRKTGDLMDNITFDATEDQVEVGTNKKYAKLHQFGGEIKPKKGKFLKFAGSNGQDVFVKKVVIPARPFLGLEKRQVRKVNDALKAWSEKQLNG